MTWIDQLPANWGEASGIVLGAYILGCFTTGYYLVRWRLGLDVRTVGSGSVGATNVGRVLGRTGIGLTLLGDATKGAFVIWSAAHFTADRRIIALSLLAVVAGHIWPLQLRFQGGKGVATSLGALCVYDFHLLAAFVSLFLLGFIPRRKAVLPGLFAFACLPWISVYLGDSPGGLARHSLDLSALSVLAGMILVAHHRNLADELSDLVHRRRVEPKKAPPQL